jgi:hypothetical protein
MRIAADGTWFYCGSPIGRAPLVQLFASIMRREGNRYVLVTPVEKVGIKVDDAPFLAVEMRVASEADGPELTFRTNVEDLVTVDSEHPLRFEPGAYLGQTEQVANEDWFGVRSRGLFFPMCPASEIEGI